MKVSIITPTAGSDYLYSCVESVRNQTYKNIEHVVVVDGADRFATVDDILTACEFPELPKEHVTVLPYPTGTNRYNGHRIYGAFNLLVNGDYIIWLDEDNELEPNHVESLVNTVTSGNLDWAYSLRKIIDSNGDFVCNDDCENLGKHLSVLNDLFVDVNCFFVKRELAIQLAPIWYRQARPEGGLLEVDRAISAILMNEKNALKFDSNNDYTVKYRVGNTSISVKKDFFLTGNEMMLKRHNGVLPWKK